MLLPGPLFVYLLHIQLFWNSRHFCFGIRAATYDFAALRGVLLGVQLAQQKPPEQVKPLLQAALRGVYVSAGSYDLALHGIDNVEMSTMVVNATGQRRKEKTKLYYSCMISVMDVISKRTTYSMPILNK